MEPIRDYAVIGDCRSAALVSRRGSIDWLCWPRFDSPSIFGAILGEAAGQWIIAPTAPFRTERRYVPDTNVLETDLVTAGGTLRITDLMCVASEEEKTRILLADHEILRFVECVHGEVELEMVLAPAPSYGQQRPRIRSWGALGTRIETSEGLLVLRAEVPVTIVGDAIRARVRLGAGETRCFSLTFADEWQAVLPPLGAWSRESLARSIRWWRSWLRSLAYDGPDRDAVARSALVLKLMVYAPSGAIVAAPTTSLPEHVGGELNWDYRFCWLRDASLTVRALFGLGFEDEAETFVSWLLHSTRLTWPELRVLYDVYGGSPAAERTLDHLPGYQGSRPVRIGNAASDQLQLDVYGEVIDAAAQFVRRGGRFDRETQRMLREFGEFVCQNWRKPDEGIWEPRSGARHNTHSRVLCWTALDRLLSLHSMGHLRRIPVESFADNRALIRSEVEQRGWNPRLRSYTSHLDSDDLDASTLLLSWYGFEDASSERMRQTYACVQERLGAGDGLLYRYRSDESPGEGAFGICSFWGAEYLALGGGTVEQARALFDRLCAYGNDVGLFAEEIDPASGDAVGNFPQAFTHVGLINAALTLARRLEAGEPIERHVSRAADPMLEAHP